MGRRCNYYYYSSMSSRRPSSGTGAGTDAAARRWLRREDGSGDDRRDDRMLSANHILSVLYFCRDCSQVGCAQADAKVLSGLSSRPLQLSTVARHMGLSAALACRDGVAQPPVLQVARPLVSRADCAGELRQQVPVITNAVFA